MLLIDEPRYMKEGWDYFDEDTCTWKLKEDAPEWAKQEFKHIHEMFSKSRNIDEKRYRKIIDDSKNSDIETKLRD